MDKADSIIKIILPGISLFGKIVISIAVTRYIRFGSEYRADLYSCILFKKEPLIGYLKSIKDEKKLFRLSPTCEERIRNINNYFQASPSGRSA